MVRCSFDSIASDPASVQTCAFQHHQNTYLKDQRDLESARQEFETVISAAVEENGYVLLEADPETLKLIGEGMAIGSLGVAAASASFTRAIPIRQISMRGVFGTGAMLFIHEAVLAAGVPEELSFYVDVPATIGAFVMADNASALMASRGLLSKPLFPDGINWGSAAKASPFVMVGNMGVAYALDAAGLEFGSKANMWGTTFTVTTGYVGLGTTTSLLSRAAKPTADFIKLYPNVVAFADKYPRVTSAFARLGNAYKTATTGVTGGMTIAGGGILGGILQALGAAGAVSLGNWVGGGLVEFIKWAGDWKKDRDFDIVNRTWDYMNTEAAGSFLNAMFGNVIKGIQVYNLTDTFLSSDLNREKLTGRDVIFEAMQVHWHNWARAANTWVDGANNAMLTNAILASAMSEYSNSYGFNFKLFNDGMQGLVDDLTILANCEEGSECLTVAEQLEAVYSLIDMFEKSSLTRYLDKDTRELRNLMSKEGKFSRGEPLKRYLGGLIVEAFNNGSLGGDVDKTLKALRREFAMKLVELGLAEYSDADGVNVEMLKVEEEDMTPEQIKYLYGSESVYNAVAAGNIKDSSQIASEHIIIMQSLNKLENLKAAVAEKSMSGKEVADLILSGF